MRNGPTEGRTCAARPDWDPWASASSASLPRQNTPVPPVLYATYRPDSKGITRFSISVSRPAFCLTPFDQRGLAHALQPCGSFTRNSQPPYSFSVSIPAYVECSGSLACPSRESHGATIGNTLPPWYLHPHSSRGLGDGLNAGEEPSHESHLISRHGRHPAGRCAPAGNRRRLRRHRAHHGQRHFRRRLDKFRGAPWANASQARSWSTRGLEL